jgi:Tol biopolymer transport system component
VSVSAPPRRPHRVDHADPEALIEEARERARRRRRRYAAGLVLAALAGLVVVTALGRTALTLRGSHPNAALSSAASKRARPVIAFLRGGPAFRSGAPYQLELDLINADGSGLRRLAHGPWSRDDQGFRAVPGWSPDGRKLAFTKRLERSGAPCRPAGRCNDEIYVINADGTGLQRLTRNAVTDGHPVWSPDGRQIAFESGRDGPTENIYVMNADGSGLQNLTHTATTSFDFAWSPDGRRIAYIEMRIPEPSSPLYVVNADGTGKHRLTRPLALDFGHAPSWVARRADARVHGRRRHLHRPRRRHRAAQAHREPRRQLRSRVVAGRTADRLHS